MNSLKKGEGARFLNFEEGPGVLLLIFVGGPGSRVLGSWCHFYTMPIFLIKPFTYMTKKLRQKFKYLENKKSF